jgi:hypothetical protein
VSQVFEYLLQQGADPAILSFEAPPFDPTDPDIYFQATAMLAVRSGGGATRAACRRQAGCCVTAFPM